MQQEKQIQLRDNKTVMSVFIQQVHDNHTI